MSSHSLLLRVLAASVLVVFVAGAAPAYAQDGASGAGALEIRLQTGSTSVFNSLLGAPGISYGTDSKNLTVGARGGLGYAVSSSVVVGGDVNLTMLVPDEGDTVTVFGVAPFVKYVSNLTRKSVGMFVEPSIAYNVVSGGGDSESVNLFSATAWGGGHAHLSRALALQFGPYVSYVKLLEDGDLGDDDEVVLGFRFGLSAYLLQD